MLLDALHLKLISLYWEGIYPYCSLDNTSWMQDGWWED